MKNSSSDILKEREKRECKRERESLAIRPPALSVSVSVAKR